MLGLVLLLVCGLALTARPAWAALDDDRYDGNIYALYAGNGSLVPPRSSLAQALEDRRVSVLVYYLDDSSASKRFAAVVSELQRLWGQSVELMPLVTDPLQDRPDRGPADPAHYWHGEIPQVVVLDAAGKVVFEASGQVPVQQINAAISRATGLTLPASALAGSVTGSFNELNSEVVPGS
ncbi:MAG: thylakoid membrane photosystem I accumulation factor [Synechococcaceae cyanobacterium]|nr:thylakoid membrane photosystem I accumulation factor [Synechococcaceae cyanobacterium]